MGGYCVYYHSSIFHDTQDWKIGEYHSDIQTPDLAGGILSHVTHFDQLRAVKKFDGIFKKKKTCTVFLSSYRNTSGSLGEREILWEHEPQASVSTAFSSSPKLSQVPP